MTETAIGNDQFTAFWNDVLAAKFERFRNILLDGLSYHSAVPLETLKLAPGAKALDVGCGWGDTALQLARMVGPDGSVLGLDCCDTFLEKGRVDAEEAGLRNVRFVAADVQNYPFMPEFDFCFSRFGMMFFSNPVAAMRNISRALKPGGRIAVIDKNAEQWGRLETPEWEKWFTRKELESLLSRHCRQVSSRFISYWEDVEPDGLFLAWLAEK